MNKNIEYTHTIMMSHHPIMAEHFENFQRAELDKTNSWGGILGFSRNAINDRAATSRKLMQDAVASHIRSLNLGEHFTWTITNTKYYGVIVLFKIINIE